MTAKRHSRRSTSPRRGRPRMRVVRPRRAASQRHIPFLIASFVAVGVLVVAIVSAQALLAQTSFRMQELTRRNAELAQSSGRLQLEVAELSAPERIAKEARRLGYRIAGPGQLQILALRSRP